MKHLERFEDFNVQDMMSYPTTLSKNIGEQPTKMNAQDMMSYPTTINSEEKDDVYMSLLKPYYDLIRTISVTPNISDLSEITDEQLDEYVGFSFVMYYMKIMVLCDKEEVYILINGDLIPLTEPKEMIDILEKEK